MGHGESDTVLPVDLVRGEPMASVILPLGKLTYIRRYQVQVRNRHNLLLICYLHARELPRVDPNVIFAWAKKSMSMTSQQRFTGDNFLLSIEVHVVCKYKINT